MNTIYTIARPAERRTPTSKRPQHRSRPTAIRPGSLAVLILAWLLTLFCPLRAGAQSYTATLVGDWLETPFPWMSGLNDQGEIVGHYFPDGGTATPIVWRNGTFTELPLLPGTVEGVARGINNVGQMVGACFGPDGASQACIWENGSVRALTAVEGSISSGAMDINDAGGVVGYGLTETGVYPDGTILYRQNAIVWQGGSAQTIHFGGFETYAYSIDASGRVPVTVYDEGMGNLMPARWTPNVPNGLAGFLQILDSAGAANDINDAGVVCGYDAMSRAVLWNGITPTVIGQLPGHYWAYATGINGNGTVVGTSTFFDEEGIYEDYAAFVWTTEGGIRNLNELLNNPSGEFGVVTNSLAINSAGQILALADAAFVLLTPSDISPLLPAPTGLSSQAGDNAVGLSWIPVTVAQAYNVKRSTVSGGPYTPIAAGVTGTSYIDRTAVNGIRYYYVVTAVEGARESANSNETSAKPMATPLPPTTLSAKVAKAKVTLNWKQSTSPEIQRNRIYRSTIGGAYQMIASIPATQSWTDTSVSSKTNYRYKVSAVNSIGLESPASNEVSARPK